MLANVNVLRGIEGFLNSNYTCVILQDIEGVLDSHLKSHCLSLALRALETTFRAYLYFQDKGGQILCVIIILFYVEHTVFPVLKRTGKGSQHLFT